MESSGQPLSQDDPMIIALSSYEPPFTTPALTANLVFRVMLAIIANLVCIVPLRLLYRNGEFAAVVFIINVELRNFITVAYAVIWQDNNMESWWPGYGLCDLHPYIYNLSLSLYATCLLAIMRNLAHQVGLMRANPLTVKEKRRRNLIQAFIMFPLPLVQVAFTWPLTLNRFAVGALIGCTWTAYPAWPYLVFFVIAPVIVAILTTVYAILIYIRFRQVTQSTESVLSSNRTAQVRAQRTKRRLYRMVISILVPFLPVVCVLAALNVLDMGPLRPFDYNTIHHHVTPYPWNTILFFHTRDVDFAFLNNPYICILTAIPIFVFFGMTKDAINVYRNILLALGFAKYFPKLNQEYDPDRPAYRGSSLGSGTDSLASPTRSKRLKSAASSYQLDVLSSTSGESSTLPRVQSLDFITTADMQVPAMSQPRAPPPIHPISASLEDDPVAHIPPPNPFLFRTRLDFHTGYRLPFSKILGKRTEPVPPVQPPTPCPSVEPAYQPQSWESRAEHPQVRTRVWSEDEVALCDRADTPSSQSIHGVLVETAVTRESQHVP